MKRLFLSTLCLVWMVGSLEASIIQVDFANASLFGAPGSSIAFFAKLTNTSATDTIYFNSVGATTVSPFLNVDLTPFLLSGPAPLNPGQVSSLIEIFDVLIDSSAAPGAYVGNTASLLGGADGGNFSIFEELAAPTFDVVVTGSTAVPEPETCGLLSAGCAFLFFWAKRSKAN